MVGEEAPLEPRGLVGQHSAVGGLRAGGGQGEQHAAGECVREELGKGAEVVPDVPLRPHAGGHRFGRVDGGAAADGQHEADLMPAAQLDALVDLGQPGIGDDVLQVEVRHSGLLQGGGDPVVQAIFLDEGPAQDDEAPLGVPGDLLADGLLAAPAEDDLPRIVVDVVIHAQPPPISDPGCRSG